MALFSARKASAAQTLHIRELEAKAAAMDRSQAVIEFKLDGTVIDANDNFLKVVGYSTAEVIGRHHRMFMDPAEAAGPEYAEFWRTLNRGEFVSDKFRRIAKGGGERWIQASYNPVLDDQGRPYKVIKFALDVTAAEQKQRESEAERARVEREQTQLIQALADSLSRLSDGDLTTLITEDLRGEYAQIKDDFNRAVPALRAAIRGIADATLGLRHGSGDIARAADDLSHRTEQQAASLEETAAALDQITATVRRSAEGAKAASSAASLAKTDAAASSDIVREAVSAMSEIDESSRQIGQIIGVIDEIAFQTNLLALNAGVEAARAGDAGRGFAVVATEVRALAQRSAEAAKEIKALISSSNSQVKRGVQLVGDTGEALSKIAGRVVEIDELIMEMARSSQEQAVGLDQVNAAINQMDQVTQQNAAMVEQTNAAASALRGEADELGAMVGRFAIGDRSAGPVAAQQARVRAYAGAA